MNVKLHTPKTLKAGSGLSSAKQFFLSLIATTISIILTFGTAAIIDNHKKKADKKEMVMMVISDFDKTLEIVQKADTLLREASRLQQELAVHPEYYDSLKFSFLPTMLLVDEQYSETAESVFSTSIETFNTIGNANFVNDVSTFYSIRRKFKEHIVERLKQDAQDAPIVNSYKSLMDISFPEYVYLNWALLSNLKECRDLCMKRMNISEEDISKFNKQQTIESANPENDSIKAVMLEEFVKANDLILEARNKVK